MSDSKLSPAVVQQRCDELLDLLPTLPRNIGWRQRDIRDQAADAADRIYKDNIKGKIKLPESTK